MQTTLMSSKGQIIIPKELRDQHRWHAGTRLVVEDTGDGILLKPLVDANKTALSKGLAAIRKRIAYQGAAVSIEEMNAAVSQEAVRRNELTRKGVPARAKSSKAR